MASLQTGCSAASDEVAEAFVMGTLSPNRATLFGRHVARCAKCAEEVENTRAFVLAMCDAMRAMELRDSNAGE
jgi:anti-sigma factor RsiW